MTRQEELFRQRQQADDDEIRRVRERRRVEEQARRQLAEGSSRQELIRQWMAAPEVEPPPEELADEQRDIDTTDKTLRALVAGEIDRVFPDDRPGPSAEVVAQRLLRSYDDDLGRELHQLLLSDLSPRRIVAHAMVVFEESMGPEARPLHARHASVGRRLCRLLFDAQSPGRPTSAEAIADPDDPELAAPPPLLARPPVRAPLLIHEVPTPFPRLVEDGQIPREDPELCSARRALLRLLATRAARPASPPVTPPPAPGAAAAGRRCGRCQASLEALDDASLLLGICPGCGASIGRGPARPAQSARQAAAAEPRPASEEEPQRREFPEPKLVLDFASPRGLQAPVAPKPEPKRGEPRAPRDRRVLGHVRTKVDMTFHEGAGKFCVLRAGTVIELIEPNERDRVDLAHWERHGRQHVTVRWYGGISLVMSRDVERTDELAFRAQEEQKDP